MHCRTVHHPVEIVNLYLGIDDDVQVSGSRTHCTDDAIRCGALGAVGLGDECGGLSR